MKKLLLLPLILFVSYSFGQTYKAFVNATLVNSNGDKPLANSVIIIKDNRIEKVGKNGKVKIPPGAETIDVQGKYIIPGLIDSHVHFFQSGGLYTRPDAVDLREVMPYAEELNQIKKRLPRTFASYLRAGVTAVADVGGPMLNFEIREQANQTKKAPRLVVAGPLISTVANPKLDIGDPPIVKVTSIAEVDNLVQQLADKKADLIKIWFIVSPQLNFEDNLKLIKRTIDQSHARGIRVAVHATQLETAKESVKAGADILVHSVDDKEVDNEFIKLLKQHGTIYTSSISVLDGYARTFTQQFDFIPMDFAVADPYFMGTLFDLRKIPEAQIPERAKSMMLEPQKFLPGSLEHVDIAKKNLKKLQEAGVTIATGTDAGNIGTLHATSMHQELRIMQAAGLSPMEILKNSTLNGAKLMGKEKDLGSLEAGKFADMVILNNDPLLDAKNYSSISAVVKDGNIFTPAELLPPTAEELVQRQAVAYNARNLDGFLAVYSPQIKMYNFPDELILEGMDKMRERYTKRFSNSTNLYAEIVNRSLMGDYVIDHEKVTGLPNGDIEANVIYHIENGLIDKVWYINK